MKQGSFQILGTFPSHFLQYKYKCNTNHWEFIFEIFRAGHKATAHYLMVTWVFSKLRFFSIYKRCLIFSNFRIFLTKHDHFLWLREKLKTPLILMLPVALKSQIMLFVQALVQKKKKKRTWATGGSWPVRRHMAQYLPFVHRNSNSTLNRGLVGAILSVASLKPPQRPKEATCQVSDH